MRAPAVVALTLEKDNAETLSIIPAICGHVPESLEELRARMVIKWPEVSGMFVRRVGGFNGEKGFDKALAAAARVGN